MSVIPVLLVHLRLGCGANFEMMLFELVHLSGLGKYFYADKQSPLLLLN